jgi:cytochrome c oxidase subunit 1
MASLEYSGKKRGGFGWVAWIGYLPWTDPSFVAQVLAMIIFAAGGIGGIINASYNLNLIVHNTTWIPGHFHLTVGTASTLTFMGITYWLLPYLTKRKLWGKWIALAQAYLWFIGMVLFGRGMHWAGLLGAPRRVPFAQAAYAADLAAATAEKALGGFDTAMLMTAVGGTTLFVSGMLYFVVVIGSVLTKKNSAQDVEIPFAEAYSGPDQAPAILDRWGTWVAAAFVMVLFAYIPTLISVLNASAFNSPGLPAG